MLEYAGERSPPGEVMSFRGYTGKQTENRFSHWIWRQYASAFWDDVRIDRVLPFRSAKDEEDEKHIHPLQLDLRVASDGGLKSALVTLYPDDEEWSCDCDSTAEACLHAAAAAIAWNRSRTEGKSLFTTSALAHVGYRFTADRSGALVFERALVLSDNETPLLTSLTEASKSALEKTAM